MDPAKIFTVTSWPIPKSHKQLQHFCGFANLLLSNYSFVVPLLTDLTSSRVSFQVNKWAFQFPSGPVGPVSAGSDHLQIRNFMFHVPSSYNTWPLQRGIRINQELLVVKMALKDWQHWLEGARAPFLMWTYNKNLEYIQTAKCWSLVKHTGLFSSTLQFHSLRYNNKPTPLPAPLMVFLFPTLKPEVQFSCTSNPNWVSKEHWRLFSKGVGRPPWKRTLKTLSRSVLYVLNTGLFQQAISDILHSLPICQCLWSHIFLDFGSMDWIGGINTGHQLDIWHKLKPSLKSFTFIQGDINPFRINLSFVSKYVFHHIPIRWCDYKLIYCLFTNPHLLIKFILQDEKFKAKF